ncbi:hypothetical protein ACPEIC_35835 [Stenotrophomonas sp. NPDC087984]
MPEAFTSVPAVGLGAMGYDFGASLAAADVNDDGYAYVLAGVPGVPVSVSPLAEPGRVAISPSAPASGRSTARSV